MNPNYNYPNPSLPGDILRTVAYFDLFDYPVTAGQIYSFLPRNSITPDDVSRTVLQMVQDGKLKSHRDYFLLSSSDQKIAEQRRNGERSARRMLLYARMISHGLKRIPFTRAVFITGSLSKSVAEGDSDIDFMIVTAPHRLWIVRSMLTFFRKVFLLGSRKYFCTNYYVTENGFPLDRRNLYAAIEVVTTKPIWNADAFVKYQECNSWTKEFLPNMSVHTDTELMITPDRSWIQMITEFVMNLLPLTYVNHRLMEYHRTYWNNAYRHIDKDRRESMFIIHHDASACWPDDQQLPVLSRYQKKLSTLGLL